MGRTLSSPSVVRVHDRPVGGLGAKLIRGGVEVGTYSGNYAMQAANDAAQNGDRILVNPGRYTQGMLDQLYLYKNISLEANGGLVQIEKQIVLNGPGLPASGMNPVIAISWQAHGQGYPTLRGNVAIKGFEIFQTQNIPDRTWYPGAADGRLVLVIHAFDMNIVGSAGDLLLERLYLHDAACGVGWTNGMEKPSAKRSSTLTVRGNIWRRLGNQTTPTNHHLYGGDSLGVFEGNLFEATHFPEAKVPPTIVPGTPEYAGDDPGYPPYGDGHILKWQCDEMVVRGNAFVFAKYGTNSPMIDCAYGCKLVVQDNWLHMDTYALAQDSLIRYGRLIGAQDSPEGGSYAEHWREGNNWTIERNTLVNASQNFFRDTNRHIEISLSGYGFGHNPPNGNGHIPNPAGYDAYLNSKHPNGWANPSTIQHNVFAGPGNPPTTDPGGIGIWGSPYPANKAVPLADLVDPAVRFSGWELKDYAGAKLASPVARKQYVHGDDPAAGIWPSCIDVVSDHYGAVAGAADQTPAWFKAIAPNTWGHITRADGYSLAGLPNAGVAGQGGWMAPGNANGFPAAPTADKQVYTDVIGGSLWYVDACGVLCPDTAMYSGQVGALKRGSFSYLPPVGGHGGVYNNASYALGPIDSDDCRHFTVTQKTTPDWSESLMTPTGRAVSGHTYGTPTYISAANVVVWNPVFPTIPGSGLLHPGDPIRNYGDSANISMKLGLNTYTDTSNDSLAFRMTTWAGAAKPYNFPPPVAAPLGQGFNGESNLVYDAVRDELWDVHTGADRAYSVSKASLPNQGIKTWQTTQGFPAQWSPIAYIDGRFIIMSFNYAPWQWFIWDRDYQNPAQVASAFEHFKPFATAVTVSGLPSVLPPRTWANNRDVVTSLTRAGSTATIVITGSNSVFPVGVGQQTDIGIYGADQAEYNGTFRATVVGSNTATFTVSGSPATTATGAIYWKPPGGVGACSAYDPEARKVYIYYHTLDGLTVNKDLWVIQLPATLITYDASWNPTVAPWTATRLAVSGGLTPEYCFQSVFQWVNEEARVKAGMRKNFAFLKTANGVKGIFFNTRLDAPPSFFRLP